MSQDELLIRLLEALDPHTTIAHMVTPPPERLQDDIVCWRPFDGAPFDHYVRVLDDCYVGSNRQSEFSTHEGYCAFLSSISQDALSGISADSPLGVVDCDCFAEFGIGHIAIYHPTVARASVASSTDFMLPIAYGAWPCFRCEIVGDETPVEAEFRMRETQYSDLRRDPQPALRMRYRSARAHSAGGGKRWNCFTFHDVTTTLARVQRDQGFMEIENFERATVKIICDPRCEVRADDDTWYPAADSLEAWVRTFCFEGVEAAARERREV